MRAQEKVRSTVEKSLHCFTEYICYHKQNVGKNMNIRSISGENAEEIRNIIRNRKTDNVFI